MAGRLRDKCACNQVYDTYIVSTFPLKWHSRMKYTKCHPP